MSRSPSDVLCRGEIEDLICFLCARVFPRCESLPSQPISWVPVHRDGFLGLDLDETEEVFSTEAFLENYGVTPGGTKLKDYPHEFLDWEMSIPFPGSDLVEVLCCAEDLVCSQHQDLPINEHLCCSECSAPLYRECIDSLHERKLPPQALANDMQNFYAPKTLYLREVTVFEMVCASPCITAMICYSLEHKQGALFDSQVHMSEHRIGARGDVTTFPLPWEAILQEMRKIESEQELALPRGEAELEHSLHVLLKAADSAGIEDWSKFIHQAKIRRDVAIRLICEMIDLGHPSYVGLWKASVIQRAQALPVDGIPPLLVHLLAHDDDLLHVMVQKAAVPVDARANTEMEYERLFAAA